jgi:hypothetical protein
VEQAVAAAGSLEDQAVSLAQLVSTFNVGSAAGVACAGEAERTGQGQSRHTLAIQ